jgi:hypothetical protein
MLFNEQNRELFCYFPLKCLNMALRDFGICTHTYTLGSHAIIFRTLHLIPKIYTLNLYKVAKLVDCKLIWVNQFFFFLWMKSLPKGSFIDPFAYLRHLWVKAVFANCCNYASKGAWKHLLQQISKLSTAFISFSVRVLVARVAGILGGPLYSLLFVKICCG